MRDNRPPPTSAHPLRGRLALLVLLLGVVLIANTYLRRRPTPPNGPGPLTQNASTLTPEVLQEFLKIEQDEKAATATIWASEDAAQAWANGIDAFWNRLNQHRGELDPLLSPPARSLSCPTAQGPTPLPLGILSWQSATQTIESLVLRSDPRIAAWRAEGWGLEQSEWRHVRFDAAASAPTAVSHYDVRLHFTRPSPPARIQIAARLRITWPAPQPAPGTATEGDWVVEHYEILRRDGEAAFQENTRLEVPPFPRTTWIDPLIAPSPATNLAKQFLLAARNLRITRGPDGTWSVAPLSSHHPGLIFTALLADFNGDGHDDLLCVVRSGILLLPGASGLAFEQPAQPAWTAPERLHYAQAITCGDIDQDGDLDLFLGQYRTPYEGGQMPRPYFDALDGPPAYLLRNQGNGRFEDITPGSALAAKRHRRSYGASFADLDADGDLDLLVTSDFAGVDVYENDGTGRFTDRTTPWIDETRAFGMSHEFSDFDADGILDFFMAGMPQPTADRLQALGLERPGFEAWKDERSRVSAGNRLYFGGPTGYRQRPSGTQISRAGWAWSAASLDLNHDRFPELCVVNGHESRSSVRDYEREFWLHDIYVGNSTPKPAADAYFSSKFATTRAEGWSYGGYDKNRLYLNLGAERFVEVGHVLGLALETDCRNVVADDFDGDGDEDLLVTTFEVWPAPRQTLRMLENTLPPAGHWIEIQPQSPSGKPSVIGATVHLRDASGRQVRTLVTGAGYRSQAGLVAHFGIGDVTRVDAVEVHWPDGGVTRTQDLAADQRHILRPPERPSQSPPP